VDVDRTYISRLERGFENPTVAMLDKLASALSAHISEFLEILAQGAKVLHPLQSGRKAAGQSDLERIARKTRR
jgi:transcriptional regulator with XRE-family HTH domain